MTQVQNIRVETDEEGLRLDRWFRSRFPQLGHGRLQKMLRKGQVRVDGTRIKASHRVQAGESIRVPPMPEPQKSGDGRGREKKPRREPCRTDIKFACSLLIYEDEDFIALNKPFGLPVQGGSGQGERHIDGLLDAFCQEGQERPRLVHRLDRDTSGVLVLAKNRKAAAQMGKLLRSRQCTKLYWALAAGSPRPERGEIRLGLRKAGGPGREKMRICEDGEKDCRRAISRYEMVERAGQKMSFLALTPLTGRTHQLRVHMAAIGHPIIGDGKYGGASAHPGGEISSKLHLHARCFSFDHPVTGQRVSIWADLPKHMQKSWELLGLDEKSRANPFEPSSCAGGACRI
jgi:23S rRNA pseudouridine955/2504/2580 synthase